MNAQSSSERGDRHIQGHCPACGARSLFRGSGLDDRLAVIRSLGHTVRALNEIALLQDSCPLAAEIAVRALREVKAEVAPDVELESMSMFDALGQGRC